MEYRAKRIVTGTISVVFILMVAFGLLYYFVNTDLSKMCSNEIIAQANSPDSKYKALVFHRSCGETTGFSTQISVLDASEELKNVSGNIFIAVRNTKAPQIELHWIDSSNLVIKNTEGLKHFRKRHKIRSIIIHYE